MKRTLIFFAILSSLVGGEKIAAQGIKFSPNGHVQQNANISVFASAPVDTATEKSGVISYGMFLNGLFQSGNNLFSERDTLGWFESPLLDLTPEIGIHTICIQFADSFTRVFNFFVSDKVGDDVQNVFETDRTLVSSDFAGDLANYLDQKLKNSDSTAMSKQLPDGFKAALCIDFWAAALPEEDGHQVVCTASQFLFNLPAGVNDDKQLLSYFRDFLGAPASSPINALLGTRWQLTERQFDKNRLPVIGDLFSSKTKFDILQHANKTINQKIHIGYFNGKQFKRILIYIDS